MTTSRSTSATTTAAAPEPSAARPTHLHLVGPTGSWGGEVTLTSTGALTAHPLSARLPAMSAPERSVLCADIATRGITTALDVTPAGVILDGHARVALATELGLTEVPVRRVDPPDEIAYILTCAIARRHLSASQRAAIAIECTQYRHACAQAQARRLGVDPLSWTPPVGR